MISPGPTSGTDPNAPTTPTTPAPVTDPNASTTPTTPTTPTDIPAPTPTPAPIAVQTDEDEEVELVGPCLAKPWMDICQGSPNPKRKSPNTAQQASTPAAPAPGGGGTIGGSGQEGGQPIGSIPVGTQGGGTGTQGGGTGTQGGGTGGSGDDEPFTATTVSPDGSLQTYIGNTGGVGVTESGGGSGPSSGNCIKTQDKASECTVPE